MLSKPIASGVMLAVLIGAVSTAALQSQDGPDAAGVTQVETADAETEVEERTATAPNRVVDSAGFPVVPEASAEAEVPKGPIVTVDGRPLGGVTVPEIARTAPQPEPVAVPEPEAPAEAVEVAVSEPPRPMPRPEGLVAPTSAPDVVDYDAIAAVAGAAPETEFMSPEQRRSLVTTSETYTSNQPNADGLVQIVGPSGQVIWVYADQLQANDSRVTVQRPQPDNPFGFVYD
ncbi:hypothetical protein [Pelagibacterium lacus]|uniref:Uncharacterized protein n=1 Tax=Pelagibacterium lacus TaxID=2282655 RepID=A0A369W827_9HYPH|nr:hypothetical protein [Pelagibacterium lacus]RDE10187.1 hypothetical protein DVH29_01965 [Pelagibacterium lacus]